MDSRNESRYTQTAIQRSRHERYTGFVLQSVQNNYTEMGPDVSLQQVLNYRLQFDYTLTFFALKIEQRYYKHNVK